jgi:hypothetical protein
MHFATLLLLQFLAEEVRLLLAKMGYRSLSELIGRADLLATRTDIQLQKSEVRAFAYTLCNFLSQYRTLQYRTL